MPLAVVREYVDHGFPIVWNAARGATPALDALVDEVARAFGAHAWPNIYATGGSATPLDFHFDAHEVLALQCEGQKEWRISKLRVDRPLDLPALMPRIRETLAAQRAEAMAQTLMTVVASPGDVLYIPRGQFHNARSVGGRSLHIAFGITPLSGIDAVEALAQLALADPAFRYYLPLRLQDPDGTATRAALADLGRRLAVLAEGDAVPALLAARSKTGS